MRRIVVVGAGLAGLRAAQGVRSAGYDGELVIVGDEPHLPYNRPPLSKALLAGAQSAAECAFPGVDGLEASWRLSTAVTSVDAPAHTVALGDGTTLEYDRLILATGCRARPLPDAAGPPAGDCVHTLRNLDDAERLRAGLEPGVRLVIVGAGFVGCEVAATARAGGVDVTLIDIAEQPLAPLGPELGARIADLHRGHGVELRLGVGLDRLLLTDDRLTGVALADGTTVAADRVLVALGAVPNTEFLAGSGIELTARGNPFEAGAGGVACDATLTSISDPDVLAAGDIAAWPAAGGGRVDGERVRVEHWSTAGEHGRLAGANANLEPAARRSHLAPPYFWSDQYDCKIQSVGFPGRAARITIVEEEVGEDGVVRLLAEALGGDTPSGAHSGQLVGAVAFNQAKRLAEYRRRLAAIAPAPTPDAAA